MSRLTPLQTATRAARQNPAFRTAVVYKTSIDAAGAPNFTAAGELQYSRSETTLGFADKTKESTLTYGPTYLGSQLVTILSAEAVTGAALILIDGNFYAIMAVHSSDILRTQIAYDCKNLSLDDAPVILDA